MKKHERCMRPKLSIDIDKLCGRKPDIIIFDEMEMTEDMSHNPYYWTCPNCGSNLDHGERCDCQDKNYPCTTCIHLEGNWCAYHKIILSSPSVTKKYNYVRECHNSNGLSGVMIGVDLATGPDMTGDGLLNEHGKYVLRFAHNYGITIAEAHNHPTVKAHQHFCDVLEDEMRKQKEGFLRSAT